MARSEKKMMWSGYFCSFFVNSNERFLSNARDHKVMPIKENLNWIQITKYEFKWSQIPTCVKWAAQLILQNPNEFKKFYVETLVFRG